MSATEARSRRISINAAPSAFSVNFRVLRRENCSFRPPGPRDPGRELTSKYVIL